MPRKYVDRACFRCGAAFRCRASTVEEGKPRCCSPACASLLRVPWKLCPDVATLRTMYVEQRSTTRAIAQHFGTNKTQVLRWMRQAGITARPKSSGLAHRGVAAPTVDELHHMVHVEHLPYREIAARYGVDDTAVPYWLRKHGIPRPKVWDTRRKGIHPVAPESAELASLYERFSSTDIAHSLGVSENIVFKWLAAAGIASRKAGWTGRKEIPCADGHVVKSAYEQRVDDWLSSHDIAHEYEPHVPWHHQSRADFRAGAVFIEVWGVTHNAKYKRQAEHKRARFTERAIPLLELYPDDFTANGGRYAEKLTATFL